MRILTILYFYEPYTSGLTIYAARIADGMVARGHDLTVLSGRYDAALPKAETAASGVQIIRLPVAARLDRAIILPGLLPAAFREMRACDVVHIHAPMAEAAALVAMARAMGKRVVMTFHSDLVIDANPMTRLAVEATKWSGILAGKMAQCAVVSTESRAKVSPTSRRMGGNLRVIPPPIVAPPAPAGARQAFREARGWGDRPVVGYVGRYTSEKAIDRLLASIGMVRAALPEVVYALVGPVRDPRSGVPYAGPWDPYLRQYAAHIDQLDRISDEDLSRFYTAIDVLALPSIDWTETFGMVQIEAMLRGTPVIASDMPGVNEPVTVTGAGKLIRPGNVDDLAAAVVDVIHHPEMYRPDVSRVKERYSFESTLDRYEEAYGT